MAAIRSEFPAVTDFEREFPSLCFALATGVGKTRLMGAFISYLYLAHGVRNFFVLAPSRRRDDPHRLVLRRGDAPSKRPMCRSGKYSFSRCSRKYRGASRNAVRFCSPFSVVGATMWYTLGCRALSASVPCKSRPSRLGSE